MDQILCKYPQIMMKGLHIVDIIPSMYPLGTR